MGIELVALSHAISDNIIISHHAACAAKFSNVYMPSTIMERSSTCSRLPTNYYNIKGQAIELRFSGIFNT